MGAEHKKAANGSYKAPAAPAAPTRDTAVSQEVSAAVSKRKEVDFRATHGLMVAFMLLLFVVKILGIYLFTSGFLLTRLVLQDRSQCAEPPADIQGYTAGSFKDGCWHPKTFDKAVIIIIDALRYDFTVPFKPSGEQDSPRAFHDGFPILYETAVKSPSNAVLLPFIADPPTTTLQRLKGLTTGTLPTFIDAGSNFAGTAIDEDNLIMQAVHANKTVVQLGDDTWHSLFPAYFDPELTKPFDSFNVWDLHTVDNGVTTHLLPLLQPANASRWDLLFGHYLGVDHAGHRYGPDHPAMKSKLAQMDNVIREVMASLDDKTLLVVMGDHGMDAKGDHGGESDDEVEAALWMYSKAPVFGRSSAEKATPPATAKQRPVFQIDLVPTLAYLLGLPVPFNNLGSPIEEAFIKPKGNDYANLAAVNRLTAAQIRRYQREYAVLRKPDRLAMALPDRKWAEATVSWASAAGKKEQLSAQFLDYQRTNLQVCKDLWARFDLVNMAMGVLILTFSFALLICFARGLHGDTTAISTVLFVRGLIGLVTGAVLGAALGFAVPVLGLLRMATFLSSLFCCIALSLQLGFFSDRLKSVIPRSIWSWYSIIAVGLICAGFGSNSYTIWEDDTTMFMIAGFSTLMLAAVCRIPGAADRKAGFYHVVALFVSLRLATFSRLCRDEQMPFCRSTYYASSTSSTSAPWQLTASWLVALILPSTMKLYYQRTQSYQGSAPVWIGVAFQLSLLLVAVFWTLEVADDGNLLPDVQEGLLKTIRMYVAQFVLAVAVGAGSATFAYSAPCIGIESVLPSSASRSAKKKPTDEEPSRPQLVVHGTGNMYGAHYALLPLTVVLIPLLLVSKPMGQAVLALATIALLSLFELSHLLQRVPRALLPLKPGQPQKHPLQAAAPPASQPDTITTVLMPTLLALIAHLVFFKTGHQAVLSSLQWDSAFVALRTIRYPWSPLLVVLNTAAGQILAATAVPACVLWRRPHRFFAGTTTAEGTVLSNSSGPVTADDERARNAGRDSGRRMLLSTVVRASLVHAAVFLVLNVASTICAGHLRRHLMLYRVFSPRWMMSVIDVVIVDLVLALVGVLGVGRSVSAVAGVFGW